MNKKSVSSPGNSPEAGGVPVNEPLNTLTVRRFWFQLLTKGSAKTRIGQKTEENEECRASFFPLLFPDKEALA